MIGHNPILVPNLPGFAALFPNIAGVDWDADWGFIVGGDNYRAVSNTLAVTHANQAYSRCNLELQFAANYTHDAAHWVFARRAAVVFHQALLRFSPGGVAFHGIAAGSQVFFDDDKRWYPLQTIVNYYNAQIALEAPRAHLLPAAVPRWQLRSSPSLAAFMNGATIAGETWEPYIQVENAAWTDTQVNYEIDLEFLYTNTSIWLDMWKNTWLTTNILFPGNLDPPNGHSTRASLESSVYRNQFTLAVWRLAKQKANDFFRTRGLELTVGVAPGNVTQAQFNQLHALLMYIFAFGAITPILDRGTYKGSYSQFAKTSPASIAHAIGWPNLQPHFTSGAAIAAANAAYAAMIDYDQLHSLMPTGSAYNGEIIAIYRNQRDPILSPIPGPPPRRPDFLSMWRGTFNQAANVALANNFGYQLGAPFSCYYAFAHTSKSAVVYNGNKVKFLMESRFSHNRLNIGFNPMCPPASFMLAYNSILALSDAPNKDTTLHGLLALPADFIGTQVEQQTLITDLNAAQKKGVH